MACVARASWAIASKSPLSVCARPSSSSPPRRRARRHAPACPGVTRCPRRSARPQHRRAGVRAH
eukprot:430036-Alexandrium_andersonii.AAC.1